MIHAELNAALNAFQAKIQSVPKDSVNPHFRSGYASMTAIWNAIRRPLTDEGLAITQVMEAAGDRTVLVTALVHKSGQTIESRVTLNPVKNDPQGFGSCLTYMRRYSIEAILGLDADDDDGAVASKQPPSSPKQPEVSKSKLISEAQQKRLFAIKSVAGWTDEAVKKLLKEFGYESSKDIKWHDYEEICAEIENNPAKG